MPFSLYLIFFFFPLVRLPLWCYFFPLLFNGIFFCRQSKKKKQHYMANNNSFSFFFFIPYIPFYFPFHVISQKGILSKLFISMIVSPTHKYQTANQRRREIKLNKNLQALVCVCKRHTEASLRSKRKRKGNVKRDIENPEMSEIGTYFSLIYLCVWSLKCLHYLY